ncbi:Maf family protein [Sessilibacter corallicola]|uniref:Maf family protein n=1 Tax=Sessilibacter corallicola TaxID=2904075 RepID=UPI001E5B66F5|nr:Maf family nucleotide pyrophosphatase [Sessilibacter corallicola]MCE2030222.1 Maf family nucleotide pyrophosphatase [Sessilibacter corallicola]
MQNFKLVLASTSPYRAEILTKLNTPFIQQPSDIEETEIPGETPDARAMRLSREKAEAVVKHLTNSSSEQNDCIYLVIGSDQVAHIDGEVLHKPGNFDNAVRQLKKSSGKQAAFHTGLTLINAQSGEHLSECEITRVNFLELTESQITNYLKIEEPYNCAGSFKSEGLGVTLFESVETSDPNSLVGLPLIKLTKLLRKFGVEPLS